MVARKDTDFTHVLVAEYWYRNTSSLPLHDYEPDSVLIHAVRMYSKSSNDMQVSQWLGIDCQDAFAPSTYGHNFLSQAPTMPVPNL